MKRLLAGLLVLGSFSSYAIDCTLTSDNGEVVRFSNSGAWNGPIAGNMKSVIGSLATTEIGTEQLNKMSNYDILIQRRSGDDLMALDAGRLFKAVIYRDNIVLASNLTPIEEELVTLRVNELKMTLECEPTRFIIEKP